MIFSGLRNVSALGLIAALSTHPMRSAAQDATPDAPAVAAPVEATPAPATRTIPAPVEVAWNELHLLQEQERQLWLERGHTGLALPITGVVLGIPMFSVMVPIGAIMVADARDANCSGSSGTNGRSSFTCSDDRHERAIGRALLAFGTIGAIMIGVGAWGVARMRHRRHAFEGKLESIGQRRTLLEHVVEAQMRGLSVSY